MEMDAKLLEGVAGLKAMGDFGDARLKKLVRSCIAGWLTSKACVFGTWGMVAPEKFALAASWPIRA